MGRNRRETRTEQLGRTRSTRIKSQGTRKLRRNRSLTPLNPTRPKSLPKPLPREMARKRPKVQEKPRRRGQQTKAKSNLGDSFHSWKLPRASGSNNHPDQQPTIVKSGYCKSYLS